ncbi:hypothetical protein JQ634_08640 [Bradyrhizobium sp. AUGA SZCCT0240]|jgi:hypothetical protein|uniref:hypothetical protein n=1 Tax=unclassified Bradyrhizobium TaxID=2631580 RepID=UPI001BAD4F05|nr:MULTISPECIES: hypothetical protein [unclassified Bradyrhizobium]MBR1191940.1 hypothetical protein [Bradyrhizobium sp. AUGA SZCCT0160]MBR1198419.1 hypothetical protein [Bradyrhizobium sp. AUGA SZCCT0158]MBR1243101.1 hypothetical protein [Bradyrhizobium sp. AUGA SZCCT0274]MBR1245586.1 hypothetical protein [Bradyrhizobium sp. AUGA SZCCT0169]MBR1253767.1 hypothetical protein [Bradyrhizobium sp. AUGA SZCCT0240]
MAEKSFFAGFYQDPKFIYAMNVNYTTKAMPDSVKKLKEHAGFNLATMKWGDYQPILTPKDKWPGKTHELWQESMQAARDSLSKQPNKLPLSPSDAAVPATKCDLADAAIRKCFNSEPPIQIIIDVMVKKAADLDPTLHDVKIEWTTLNAEPTLKFTMVCPFEEPKKGS